MNSPLRGTVIQGDLDIHTWCRDDLTSVKMEKPHAQAKLLSPTEKCKVSFCCWKYDVTAGFVGHA